MKTRAGLKPMLGDKARDIITGFEGIVIGKTQWLTICEDSVGLSSQELKNGRSIVEWFDETRVEVLITGSISILEDDPPSCSQGEGRGSS